MVSYSKYSRASSFKWRLHLEVRYDRNRVESHPRNFSATSESVAPRIRIDFERSVISTTAKDVLDGMGVLGGRRSDGSDFNFVGDEERTVETKTERAYITSQNAYKHEER